MILVFLRIFLPATSLALLANVSFACFAKCKKPRVSEDFEQIILGVDDAIELYEPRGCDSCSHTGYRGRTLVMEVLTLNDDLDELISTQATMQQFRKMAKQHHFKTMSEDGLRLVREGRTTIEELSRVVDLTAGLS